MRQYYISKSGNYSGGAAGYNDAIRALVQTHAKSVVAVTTPPLVDSSGGLVANPVAFVAPFVDAAAVGSSLAGQASFDNALGTVLNAMDTMYGVANALAAKLGVEIVTYTGGGTLGTNGAINAITLATGAAVGPASATANLIVANVNQSLYMLLTTTRKLCLATGDNEPYDNLASMIAAKQTLPSITMAIPVIGTTFGAAGAAGVPGVTLVAANATLAAWASIIATIAASLNAVALPGVPKIRAVS